MSWFERQMNAARQRPNGWVLLACLVAGSILWIGCRPTETPTAPESQPGGAIPPIVEPEPEAAGPSAVTEAIVETVPVTPDARAILDRMVAAYKGASAYGDKGYVEIRYKGSGEQEQQRADFLVALARPNKIRVQAYGGILVADGEKLWASIMNAPDQVLQQDAPAEMTVASILPDFNLGDALAMGPTQTFSWLPIQLILLLADDPLKTLLFDCEAPQLLEPANVDQHDCYRVQAKRPAGTCVFWIDQQTSVLRRFEFPTNDLRAMLAEGHQVPVDQIQDMALVAEFKDAQLNEAIDPLAFEFEVPPEARLVEHFMSPAIQWLGQPAPEFSLADLDGNAISRESLSGKIAVIDFWATWCEPCRRALPDLEQVYQKYRENEKVAFLAISVDQPETEDQKLRDTFQELGVTVPMARDLQQQAGAAFRVQGIPALFLIGPDGVVQYQKSGGAGVLELSAKLEKLLAGDNVYEEALQQFKQGYEAQKEQFEQLFAKCVASDLFVHPAMMQPEIPRAEIRERTEPGTLKLTQLWSCTELALPGNVLVVERPDGPPRVLVLEQASSVAEIATAGNVVSMKPLGVPQQQPVMLFRSDVGRDGRRFFIGSAMGAQQIHVWDEGFNLQLSYPKDALENPHPGIADLRIADLNGDGTLEMAVSYLGVVGVQGVSLDGTRVWANRSVVQSIRLALLAPDAQGQRHLLCMNNPEGLSSMLTILDAKGERQGEIVVKNRSLVWIEAADLDGDNQSELCGLAPVEDGSVEAVGLNFQGEELWSYPMPRGVHQHQIEAVSTGRLLAGQPGHWLLAGADGTIHVVGADGRPIDSFAYGGELTGLATTQWDGKHVLLVATTKSVDAWQVDLPAKP